MNRVDCLSPTIAAFPFMRLWNLERRLHFDER